MNTTAWGVVATAFVGFVSIGIAYLTNKRQDNTANRSQALVEVQAVWERLDVLEGRLVTERRWRRKATAYIRDLVDAIKRGDKQVPPLPTDFELD